MSDTNPVARLPQIEPKVELHRHLEGSLRLATIAAIADDYKLDLPTDPIKLRTLVQCTPNSPRNPAHFLSKFNVLRRLYVSEAVIRRITDEAIQDAYADGIQHLELRFSPRALSRLKGFPFAEVIRWVGETVESARTQLKMSIALIVSINRHESVTSAEQILNAVIPLTHFGIVAVDLSGMEEGYPADLFAPLFAQVRAHGLELTIHAGEWSGAANIRQAISTYHCRRIGHGIRIFDDLYTVDLARERGVVFEVCPSSNLLSGAVKSLEVHPLQAMIDAGLKVTLNTDDPSICETSLSREFSLAVLDLNADQIRQLHRTAVESAFVDEQTRGTLRATFDRYEADTTGAALG